MKKHNGGLGNFLNEITQISEKNPGEEKIIYVEIDELEENPKNFYGLREVDALAGLISVSKLIEPLTVIKNFDGKYKIISGHRRHAAIKKLISEGNFSGKIPCIVKNLEKITIEQENGEKIEFDEDAVEMLNLIASNRGQREERTIDEKLQEIKYLESFAKAIYNQKDRGNRGRFRNFFAEEISNISKSQLQRINSMAKLTAQVKNALDSKKISETAAMEMANLTAEEQNECLREILRGKIMPTVLGVQMWKILKNNSDTDEGEEENFQHGLAITFRHSRRIFGEEEIFEEKSASEWLEEVSKDFYKKLYEVAKKISAEEKDKIKSQTWKERMKILKTKLK